MKEAVAIAKEADTKKDFSPTKSDNSIHRVQNEPEMQLGSLRSVIDTITRDGGVPSVESIATELSSMHSAKRASVLQALQRTYGNRYVQRVVAGIQAKLKVGLPGDIYEQEANRVAEEVMRMPEPRVLQQMEEKEEVVMAKRISGNAPEMSDDLYARLNQSRGGGQLLPDETRAFMERRFGVDFSAVRVHTDSNAVQMTRELGARAFTYGRDIYFGRGNFEHSSQKGRQLIAHELTHTLQQKGSGHTPQGELNIGQQRDQHEREADTIADEVVKVQAESREEEEGEGKKNTSYGKDRREEKVVPIPKIINRIRNNRIGKLIQKVPAPPEFGKFRYSGFRITTHIPGFIQEYFTGDFDIDYKMGSTSVAMDAWASVWELYDSADKKVDKNIEVPFGDYTIESDKIKKGTPGDGKAKWSLWYRVTHSNPWRRSDPNYYPYDYVLFDVYRTRVKNQTTELKEDVGEVIWQDNFTPAEEGAALELTFSTTETRTTEKSQTTTVSTTVSGEKSAKIGFGYKGLTGGFENKLSFSEAVTISQGHRVSIQTSQTTSKKFTQPGLKTGYTYKVVVRPLFHLIEGSANLISHRDGVITRGLETVGGGIRQLKGIDVKIAKEKIKEK